MQCYLNVNWIISHLIMLSKCYAEMCWASWRIMLAVAPQMKDCSQRDPIDGVTSVRPWQAQGYVLPRIQHVGEGTSKAWATSSWLRVSP